MKVYVYVLRSLKDNSSYVGMTQDIINRLKEDNHGKNRYTKAHMPWVVIYQEEHESWASGRIREKYFKTSAGKKFLINNLKI
jgi:putative endonuclease